MKECRRCRRTLEDSKFERNRRTCRECRAEYRRIHKICCSYCKTIFKSNKRNAKFCSMKCSGLSRRRRTIVKCSYCGDDKEINISAADRIKEHFCNQQCRAEHMRTFMLGENNPNYERYEKRCDGCGVVMYIHRYRLETLKHHFCSRECFSENIGKYYSGENNPNWNHELTEEERLRGRKYPEYYKWRNGVFERDDYTCQSCGSSKGGTLNAHHIENYSQNKEKRTCLNNGITLCEECHLGFHMEYGFTDNNLTQLMEYINNRKSEIA